jgi:YHS domain-containing protein
MKTTIWSVVATVAFAATAYTADIGGKYLVLRTKHGLAIQGYDPVACFTGNNPVKGSARFSSEYAGARYLFANAEHKTLVDGNPAKYAPAYGGYCGYAASIGKVRPADPLLWSIVDGQLIVQHTKSADKLWKKDVAGNKMRADKYWPHLVVAKAGTKDPIDSLLGKPVLDLAKIN